MVVWKRHWRDCRNPTFATVSVEGRIHIPAVSISLPVQGREFLHGFLYSKNTLISGNGSALLACATTAIKKVGSYLLAWRERICDNEAQKNTFKLNFVWHIEASPNFPTVFKMPRHSKTWDKWSIHLSSHSWAKTCGIGKERNPVTLWCIRPLWPFHRKKMKTTLAYFFITLFLLWKTKLTHQIKFLCLVVEPPLKRCHPVMGSKINLKSLWRKLTTKVQKQQQGHESDSWNNFLLLTNTIFNVQASH